MMISIVALIVSVTIAAASQYSGFPSTGYLVKQEQNSVVPTKQVPGYPIAPVPGLPTRQVSESPAKQVPSFAFEKVFDLLSGHIPSFPTRQSSGFPTVKDSDIPAKQDLNSPYAKGSDVPAKQDSYSAYLKGSDLPAKPVPDSPYIKVSGLIAEQDPSFPSGQDPTFPAGQNPSFPAGQDPSFPDGQDFSFPAGQYPRHVSSYPGWPPGSPMFCYPPPIPGSPIDPYYDMSQIQDNRDQDSSPGSIGRLPNVPFYTSLLKDFDHASKEIQKHITLLTGDPLTSLSERNHLIQYIAIMFTIDQLIEGLVKRIPYNTERIIETYKKARTSPMTAAAVVLARLRIASSQLSLIRDFILLKQQTHCQEPNSYECNVIIDKALASSTDRVLQQQGKLLAALGQEMKLFNADYAEEIEKVSKKGTARNYVTSASERRLKPLLEAGAKARKLSLKMPVNWFGLQMELDA